LVHGGIKKHEWSSYISNVFRLLKPGNGWAQFVEINGQWFEKDDLPEECVLPKVFFITYFRVILIVVFG
jgi:hypothetical protein